MAEYATSIDIAAAPETVFEYLVTPDGMTAWMGQRAVLEPKAGGVFEVDIAGSPIRGHFLAVEPPHRVLVSWGVAGSDELPVGASTVSFTLVRTPEGTRVDLLHSGLPDDLVAGHVDGWAHFLGRLRDTASGGPWAPDDSWIPLRRRGGP